MLTVDNRTGMLLILILSIWFLCPSNITCAVNDADSRQQDRDASDIDLINLVLVSQQHRLRLGRIET